MNICWKCAHPQAIQDVDEFFYFIGIDLEKLALHHLLTNGSIAVNGCRQNASKSTPLKSTINGFNGQ